MKADVGPEREHVELGDEENNAFVLLIENHTKPQERAQLSYALRQVQFRQGRNVVDGFQRNARKMWRPDRPAGSAS